jgi:hypothetical protein
MKKPLIYLLLISSAVVKSQSGQKFATDGNSLSPNDFLGSTNNYPLEFRTNNQSRLFIGTNGILKVMTLQGIGNRLLQTDADGNITPFPLGNSSQVLMGDGTWAALPAAVNSWQLVANNIISNVSGNVGIGTNKPLYKLDVIGDARISNNLYVGGGIIITDKVKALEEVRTGAMRADSIVMDGSRAIYGDTRIEGDIDAKNKLSVTGNAQFNAQVMSLQGLNFDSQNGLKMNSVLEGNQMVNYFTLGRIANIFPASQCLIPGINQWMMNNGGGFISTQQNNSVNSSLRMYSAAWNGSGFIEVEGTNEVGAPNNALFVNWFCGRDIGLCVNTGLANGGGKVSVGNHFYANQHVEIGDPVWGIAPNNSPANNIALDMHVNNGQAMRIRTYHGNGTMYEIFNTGSNVNATTFKVNGFGKTQIGQKTQLTNTTHSNAMLTVYGKIVGTEIIVTQQNWADYVFDSCYVLKDLNSLEAYIKQNKRLPNIPTRKEISDGGLELSEISRLQMEKIEELTLYVLELKKEIDKLKAQYAETSKSVESER